MSDFHDQLAALVADTAATLEALRLQGAIVLPRGDPLPLGALPERPVHPVTAKPLAAPTSPPPRPSPSSPVPAATGGGVLPLLGGWAALAEGPAERLAKVIAALGERCEGCGEPPLVGVGALRSGLVLVCDRLTAAGQGMLTNMLVKVVNVEPGDIWTVTPRPCGACAIGLAQQVQAIRPRAALALGADAARLVGLTERGTWGSWAGVSAITTWHPAEIEVGPPPRKRAAFEVLTELARRR
ncbi:MAG: hypothetical protein EXR71_02230 [Myxococcales bacterium]|nr:hypothetical protein [Myxococcales bacterium]